MVSNRDKLPSLLRVSYDGQPNPRNEFDGLSPFERMEMLKHIFAHILARELSEIDRSASSDSMGDIA